MFVAAAAATRELGQEAPGKTCSGSQAGAQDSSCRAAKQQQANQTQLQAIPRVLGGWMADVCNPRSTLHLQHWTRVTLLIPLYTCPL